MNTKKAPVKRTPKRKTATAKKSPRKTPKDPAKAYEAFMAGDKTMELLKLADDDLLSNVKGFISTQSIALNKALELPGLPRGRIIEISGDEHTGKSTLLDHVFAETQRLGGTAILVDPEVGRDAKYSRNIGVNADKLFCPQPKEGKFYTLQNVFNFLGTTCDWWRDNHPDEIVTIGVDSIAGMPTDSDMEREAGTQKPGDAAKTIRHSLRTLAQRCAQSQICLVFVNQLYEKIGVSFGDSRAEYGGRGMRYTGSVRIRLDRGPALKESSGRIYGHVARARVMKSKLSGASGAKCEFGVLHGVGIDNTYTLFERFKQEGYIATNGSWFTMLLPGDTEPVRWQGKELGLATICRERPELYGKLVDLYMSLP